MPDTTTDEAFDLLRAVYGKRGAQSPYERRSPTPSIKPSEPALAAPGPSDGFRHADRCRDGLACATMSLFLATGRVSAVAPRHPRRDLFEQLYGRT